MPRVVIAPDKFRGTATAAGVAGAMAAVATDLGWEAVRRPLSDGGEGLLDACAARCPEVVVTRVTGPDGVPVEAQWRLGEGLAVVELARASGLLLAGGPERNDPVAATSRGTGELMVAAARRVGPEGTLILGLGGSATTDGGRGIWEAVEEAGGLGGTALVGACDVDTRYTDAAAVFGPQKGAGPADVEVLTERLERQAEAWARRPRDRGPRRARRRGRRRGGWSGRGPRRPAAVGLPAGGRAGRTRRGTRRGRTGC